MSMASPWVPSGPIRAHGDSHWGPATHYSPGPQEESGRLDVVLRVHLKFPPTQVAAEEEVGFVVGQGYGLRQGPVENCRAHIQPAYRVDQDGNNSVHVTVEYCSGHTRLT